MRALVVFGSGRYADPWHPFAENAAAAAGILADAGWQVALDDDVDHAMTRLRDVDLLVVTAGDPWGQGEQGFGAAPEAVAGLADALERGIGVLGLHAAVASLRDYPAWAAALGGVWIPGASMHPPFEDRAPVRLAPHALTAGLADLEPADERYSFVQRVGDSAVLADHEHDGMRHPLVWVREHGRARVAVDLLGHDPRSYSSPSHRVLLQRLADWAARA